MQKDCTDPVYILCIELLCIEHYDASNTMIEHVKERAKHP
jgi:hypothetical protein